MSMYIVGVDTTFQSSSNILLMTTYVPSREHEGQTATRQQTKWERLHRFQHTKFVDTQTVKVFVQSPSCDGKHTDVLRLIVASF